MITRRTYDGFFLVTLRVNRCNKVYKQKMPNLCLERLGNSARILGDPVNSADIVLETYQEMPNDIKDPFSHA
jgi:hypothetical protein